MLYQQSLPVRDNVRHSHQTALGQIASPGTWFNARERVAIISETRAALNCQLCGKRKQALSPYTVAGDHDTATQLEPEIVEVIHRLATDSGRLTSAWFTDITSRDLTAEMYVEIVGLVATIIVLDSFALGLGCEPYTPTDLIDGEPSRQHNDQVFDGGAWVPMLDVSQQESDTGLPTHPNIGRAMGLVPGANGLFFPVMSSHYSLDEMALDIDRPQIELLASRVSSHNQCFY